MHRPINNPAPILVTGGTGTLGRNVVPRLRQAGCDVRVLSRRDSQDAALEDGEQLVTGDLATGDGIDAAVDGVEIVVHCAGSAKGDEDKARQLVQAASRASMHHLVFISVVGADRIPITSRTDRAMFGYFGAKLGAEHTIAASGLPWTTVRATEFHDFVLSMAQQMARMPVAPIPSGFRVQPVDTAEVADRLVEVALSAPAGLVADIAGPRVYELAELIRDYLRATGKRRPIVPVRLPGQAARAYRAGGNLAPDRALGRRTWEDFLAAELSQPSQRRRRPPTRRARHDDASAPRRSASS